MCLLVQGVSPTSLPSDPLPSEPLPPQVQMTTTDWDECGFWLSAVKRLIKMRQQGGGA